MKVKIFSLVKPFPKKQNNQQEFEDLINNWLAENCGIEIIDIKQSASGGSFNPSEWLITVWYREVENPEIEEDQEDVEQAEDE